MHADGQTVAAIARHFGVAYKLAWNWVNRPRAAPGQRRVSPRAAAAMQERSMDAKVAEVVSRARARGTGRPTGAPVVSWVDPSIVRREGRAA